MVLQDLLGREPLEKLASKYGGIRLYVPTGKRKCDRLEALNLLIGFESVQKLQQIYGGETVDVPNLKRSCRRDGPAALRERNLAIRLSIKTNSARQTALKFGLTERQVFNILRFTKSTQKNNVA